MTKIIEIKNRKNRQPLVCLTAYSYPIAKIIDPFCDIILVGDSLGMVVYGMESTREVTLDMMINHGKAVRRAVKQALIVVDMPFGSYETSPEQALQNARRIIDETGCDAVKLECVSELADIVAFLVENKIPVMGHIGLLPQQIKSREGYKYQGRTLDSAAKILQDAISIQNAGVFAMVVEGVKHSLAIEITKKLSIPTIGIGAAAECDGQVLVIDDMLGINQDFKPKFVKNYANLAQEIAQAAQAYRDEVRLRQFPTEQNCFK